MDRYLVIFWGTYKTWKLIFHWTVFYKCVSILQNCDSHLFLCKVCFQNLYFSFSKLVNVLKNTSTTYRFQNSTKIKLKVFTVGTWWNIVNKIKSKSFISCYFFLNKPFVNKLKGICIPSRKLTGSNEVAWKINFWEILNWKIRNVPVFFFW